MFRNVVTRVIRRFVLLEEGSIFFFAKETKRDFEIPSLEVGENGDQLEHQEGITYDICFETSKRG